MAARRARGRGRAQWLRRRNTQVAAAARRPSSRLAFASLDRSLPSKRAPRAPGARSPMHCPATLPSGRSYTEYGVQYTIKYNQNYYRLIAIPLILLLHGGVTVIRHPRTRAAASQGTSTSSAGLKLHPTL